LEIVEAEGPEQWKRLLAGTLDLGIGLGPPSTETRLVIEPILLSTIDSALLPADHPLASRRSVTGQHLATFPLLALSPTLQQELHESIAPLLERAGIRSTRRVTYPTMQSVWSLVAAGRGWTLTSSLWGNPPEGTVAIPVKQLNIPFHLSLMTRPGEDRAHVRTVVEVFRKVRDGREESESESEDGDGASSSRISKRQPAMHTINLRHLRYFATVVDTGGFSRGAVQLGITQPALSRQIRSLETSFGVPLLKRIPGGLRVTPAGEVLRGEIDRIEHRLMRLLADVRTAHRGMKDQLVIGTVTTPITGRIITQALRVLQEQGKDLEPHVVDVASTEQEQALREGKIDIAICHSYPRLSLDPVILRERLVEDVIECALLSLKHPLAERSELVASELATVPFIFIPRWFHPAFYDRVMTALEGIGLTPRIDREYTGVHTIWSMAGRGHGWALGFRSHRKAPPENLVAVGVKGFALQWGLDLAWRRQATNAQVEPMLEALRQAR